MIVGAALSAGGVREGFPIRYVRLEGQLQHLRPGELEKVLKPLLEDGYFGLDLSQLVAAVKQLPWVDEVRVERIWPDVLKVWIREQIPYLRWGKTDLLNPRGEKFTPQTIEDFADLPRLEGLQGQEQHLPARQQAGMFEAYRDMAEALKPLQLKILRLAVDARRSWQLTLEPAAHPGGTGMIVILGREQPQRVFAKVAEFLARLPADQRQRILRLDARYEHGFAIRWRESASAGKANP